MSTLRIERRLSAMGLALPAPQGPIANYVLVKRLGALLFVSGRVSDVRGIVGVDVSREAAHAAARDTMLQLLSIVKGQIGSLDDVSSVMCVRGFVRSGPSFTDLPYVIDGASDLLIALWGDEGRHTRTATGAAQLPFGAAVQIDMIMGLAGRQGSLEGQDED
jgi:enamine deaminase RidA (YjgF/YER057c/UK114 family)